MFIAKSLYKDTNGNVGLFETQDVKGNSDFTLVSDEEVSKALKDSSLMLFGDSPIYSAEMQILAKSMHFVSETEEAEIVKYKKNRSKSKK